MNSAPRSPRWARWLLTQLHPEETLEEVEGDLDELYVYWYRRAGKIQATLRYLLNVLTLLPPFVRRREPKQQDQYQPLSNLHPSMLRNYGKIAWRNLVKNKVYSLINIGGLAVGMTVAMLIGLWIYDELTFDQYHQHYDRVARVTRHLTASRETYTTPIVPYALGEELKTKYGDQFKRVVVAWPANEYILSAADKILSQWGEFIEAGAPEMLSLEMVKGTRDGLRGRNSMFLSASLATLFFGEANPMGKRVKINNQMDAIITGVFKDLPPNSSFHELKFISSLDGYVSANNWIKEQGWTNNTVYIYAEIQSNTDFGKVSARVRNAQLNNLAQTDEQRKQNPQLFMHPMRDWYLYGDFANGVARGGRVQTIEIVGLIGGFVLLLACINFMNLSTAGSEKRAREVGIRKAIGSKNTQLIYQFLSESFLVVLLAFIMALLLVRLSLTGFNTLAVKQLVMPWTNGWFWVACLGFIGVTGFVAGSYPAFYLASFEPVKVLKGVVRAGRSAILPRKFLVVVQFTVSLVLMMGTVIVYRQIQFAKGRDVGYNWDGLLMIEKKTDDFNGTYDVLRSELKKTGVVLEISEADSKVTATRSFLNGFDWKGKPTGFEEGFGVSAVSPEYGKTVGWRFIAGRDFSRDFPSDSSGFVVNKTAANYMGMKHPVGEVVRWSRKEQTFRIIGVVDDMLMESPYEPIKPTIYFLGGYPNWINIKLQPRVSARDALQRIQEVFTKLMPSVPSTYMFADQDYARKFEREERTGQLTSIFAGLAIFISCLGVFGLASFVAERRTKEIGIRKVLGASALTIWRLLSSEFVFLVIIAFLIAIPIAYYALSDWLQQYPYRTDLSWWLFMVVGIGALAITLLTVSYQSIKAALMNPVKSLRSE